MIMFGSDQTASVFIRNCLEATFQQYMLHLNLIPGLKDRQEWVELQKQIKARELFLL